VTEYVAARTIALPFFGKMTGKQVNTVCDALEGILEKTLMSRSKRF
jgi:dTDP-4-amino-4,6-dideoxygalactose transaminase